MPSHYRFYAGSIIEDTEFNYIKTEMPSCYRFYAGSIFEDTRVACRKKSSGQRLKYDPGLTDSRNSFIFSLVFVVFSVIAF